MQSSQIKQIALTPLKDNDQDYTVIEKKIRELFRREIYLPLIRELGESSNTLHNSRADLLNAIKSGRIQFYRGKFSGRFNSSISKELKELGASWERKTRTWQLPQASLPMEVRNAIAAGENTFQLKLDRIDAKLAQILPEEIADKLKLSEHFDKTIFKVDEKLRGSLRAITVPVSLSKQQTKQIADEWQKNTELSIQDWTQKEVVKLRKDIRESVYAGNRRDALIKIIQDSHDTSINKAKFIARQETRLLLTKFKQVRYEKAGVNWYRWVCSNNPHQAKGAPYRPGQVRYDHGILEGKFFTWTDDQAYDKDGNSISGLKKPHGTDNPGQDYNCRCYAVPVVKFKKV